MQNSPTMNRRILFGTGARGLGAMALAHLLPTEATSSQGVIETHSTPKAKRVIWLFMRGGVSHMESFDPKPALSKYASSILEAHLERYI